MEDEIIEKVINSKVVEKAYDDTLSSPLVELSKIGVDFVKTARLVLAPLQITATFQDRFETFLINQKKRVPEEKVVQIPAELSSVCLERMKYLERENPLWQLFEELLINASNRDTCASVHPSFGIIISQLAPDEAVILFELNLKGKFEIEDTLDFDNIKKTFSNRQFTKTDIPFNKLSNPDSLEICYSHLDSLSLVNWPLLNQEPIWDKEESDSKKIQIGSKRKSEIHLTDFGKLFVKACIPKNGFANFS